MSLDTALGLDGFLLVILMPERPAQIPMICIAIEAIRQPGIDNSIGLSKRPETVDQNRERENSIVLN